MKPRSLSARISAAVIAVQLLSIGIAFACFPLLAPFTSYGLIADRTVRALVAESIEKGTIKPTATLLRYAHERPTLRYAALASSGVLVGSDVQLSGLLRTVGARMGVAGSTMQLPLRPDGGEAVFLTTSSSPSGSVVFATSGNRFGYEDFTSFWQAFLPAILPGYGPVLIAALLVVPLMLSRLLKPVVVAAERARTLDLAKAGRLLPIPGLPQEFEPLCIAIDAALEKARDGVLKQRIFFADAAHELRTPIAIMQIQLQQSGAAGQERDVMLGHIRRMGILVDQLLSIARLEHAPETRTILDLVDVARGVAAYCVPMALSRGVMIAYEAPATSVYIKADRRSLEGAISAIVDNATKAEPIGGEVIVCIESDGTLSVTDHGAGLDEDERRQAFEPFWRKHDDEGGFGLGLAAVRRVAEIHGGSAAIESEVGGGTRLTMWFPLEARSSG